MSQHQNVINAIIARLETITIANGYYTDIGSNVKDVAVTMPDKDTLPRVNVLDDSDIEINLDIAGEWLWIMPVLIEIVTDGTTSNQDARTKIIPDLIKAIGVDITFAGTVINTVPLDVKIERTQDEKKVTKIFFSMEITFETSDWSETL